jgi:hypothetical protein
MRRKTAFWLGPLFFPALALVLLLFVCLVPRQASSSKLLPKFQVPRAAWPTGAYNALPAQFSDYALSCKSHSTPGFAIYTQTKVSSAF